MTISSLFLRPVALPETSSDLVSRGRDQRRFVRKLTRATGPRSLLAPTSKALWTLTAGSRGALRVSPRRVRAAARALAYWGLTEGVRRDRFAVDPVSLTNGLVGGYAQRETAHVVQLVTRAQARQRHLELIGPRLPWTELWWLAGLVTVVMGIDTALNVALVERLSGVGSTLALLTSFAVSILLLLVSHLVVAGTPVGLRLRVRRTLIVVLIIGFTGFVLAGGYLRTHSATGAGDGSIGLTGVEAHRSWVTLLGPAAGYLTMIALLVTTFAAAALADLHQQTRLTQLRTDDSAASARRVQTRIDQAARDGVTAVNQINAVASQLGAVQATSYRQGLPVDAADRLPVSPTTAPHQPA